MRVNFGVVGKAIVRWGYQIQALIWSDQQNQTLIYFVKLFSLEC